VELGNGVVASRKNIKSVIAFVTIVIGSKESFNLLLVQPSLPPIRVDLASTGLLIN
jgi:hypothetical protein